MNQTPATSSRPPVLSYEVVNVFRHDRNAFCQGLAIEDGVLYEGTGKYGASSLRMVDLTTGKVLRHVRLNSQVFGEGITISGDTIIQLTWRNNVAWAFDKSTFRPLAKYQYRGEGWGITRDATQLIMSDGTPTLRFLDPDSFKVTRQLVVRDAGRAVNNLNELEYVEGSILANVWHSDRIARISPETGEVLAWIDLSGLLSPAEKVHTEAVLNGIAYDASTKRLFVTGKYWPKLFEIRVKER